MPLDLDELVLGPTMDVWGEAGQGKPVPVYMPAFGDPFEIGGVFDAQYQSVKFSEGAAISTNAPMLGVRLSAFPEGVQPLQSDRVVIRGATYVVSDVNPDGHGWVKLILMLEDNI